MFIKFCDIPLISNILLTTDSESSVTHNKPPISAIPTIYRIGTSTHLMPESYQMYQVNTSLFCVFVVYDVSTITFISNCSI